MVRTNVSSNALCYMRYAATDQVGHEPANKPHPTDPEQWCMQADNPHLADYMTRLGYEVTIYDNGWIGLAGKPTNAEAVRDLEIRQALARVEEVRAMDPSKLLVQMTGRF